ncbi:thiopurine S-methyltransferase [Paraglaciecola hydrolytica]|uniref:Thiopurine S-methyltransferase n=1 Tax=Paraglaciecola hydrolytica TaxID=1799789 RepID=A0A148KMX6_9ALTE|nr:thiopurine S-methyltransferase [Paraglaciecola hydrolytica]KXI27674.1 thiopurine S-methyltransferase [Paraglaciecola hydrolytica]
MEADFWHQRWEKGEIGFHERDINPLLISYFHQLDLPKASRIFVPLCGKTHDISWLLDLGYQVVGAELSEVAIKELFKQLDIMPRVSDLLTAKRYQGPNLDIFVGDIFKITAQQLGQVDGIYDRAALVALPSAMRHLYSQHLHAITQGAKQLLISFDYDQDTMPGPPFSVVADEVKQHYAQHYKLTLLYNQPLVGGLKGRVAAKQQVWLLDKKL